MMIHLVTDRRRLAPSASVDDACRCLLDQVRSAVSAGVDVIQIRERDLEARALLEIVRQCVSLARGTSTRIVVNERLDVALSAGAHGVHLPARAMPVAAARSMSPPGFVIGRSAHNARELAAAEGADYVIAGTVWQTISKPDAPHRLLGIDGLASLAGQATMPVLAIGGVERARIADIARAGAQGIASIGLFLGDASGPAACAASNMGEVVAEARRAFDTVQPRS
jgi:thiamine-phosphate diphosphorylase